jgi:hypothetical protein
VNYVNFGEGFEDRIKLSTEANRYSPPVKEIKMYGTRLFNILVVVALVVVAVLTIQQAAGVAQVTSAASNPVLAASSIQDHTAPAGAQCLQASAHRTVTAVYVKQMNQWLPHTDEGFTGVDGGLIYMSSLPRCK